MAQATVVLTDANGTKWSVEATILPDGNIAFNNVLTDQAGNRPSLAPGAVALQVSSDGQKATYRAGGTGLTFYSGAAAVILEIQGSASKTVRVKRIEVWAQAATKFFTELLLERATTISASGTPVVAVNGKHDKLDPAATAAVNSYAAAATVGTGAAVLGAKVLSIAPPAAGMSAIPAVWDFSRNQDKALVLRGTADVIEVFNTITGLGAGTFGFEVEWEEDAS